MMIFSQSSFAVSVYFELEDNSVSESLLPDSESVESVESVK